MGTMLARSYMNKVIRNGEVAVLYSPGYGAGWFTWNKNNPECLYSPEIVDLLESNAPITDEVCEKLFGEDFYNGGASKLVIKWLPINTMFEIKEYDGHESIELRDSTDWHTA
jgi:hypothetical protein